MISRKYIEEFIKDNSFKGRQKSFNFDKEGLQQYINWAFCNDFMLICESGGKIASTLITYPIGVKPKSIKDILPHDNPVKSNHIVVMDFIANDKQSRQEISKEFMKKYPNWQTLNKWAIRNGKLTELSNKHIEFMGGAI